MTTPRYADYATIAASLHEIADKLATLAASGLADPYVDLTIQPKGDAERGDEATIAAVDAVGQAVFGRAGETKAMSGSASYHHGLAGLFPGVSVSIYNAVGPPEVRALQAEIAELRRQRDELAGETDAPR